MRMRYDYALSCRSDRMFCITITVINGLVCALCRLTHRPLHSAEQSLVRCPVLVRNLTVLGRGSPSERDLEERGGARKELTAVPVWFGQARSPSPEGEVASGRSLSESDPPLQAATRGLAGRRRTRGDEWIRLTSATGTVFRQGWGDWPAAALELARMGTRRRRRAGDGPPRELGGAGRVGLWYGRRCGLLSTYPSCNMGRYIFQMSKQLYTPYLLNN